MKKVIAISLVGIFAAAGSASAANACIDGGMTWCNQRNTARAYDNYQYVVPQKSESRCRRAAQPTPVAQPAADAIAVHTHTEVINHYQVYQPVTVYVPAGTYAERQVQQVAQPQPRCNRCF
ncbi:MAG: hypothetical protein FWG18_02045 [Alphaproteobacteria bacterium]|nr:hypothetical protein [Alphaproteobacteria bacterium]